MTASRDHWSVATPHLAAADNTPAGNRPCGSRHLRRQTAFSLGVASSAEPGTVSGDATMNPDLRHVVVGLRRPAPRIAGSWRPQVPLRSCAAARAGPCTSTTHAYGLIASVAFLSSSSSRRMVSIRPSISVLRLVSGIVSAERSIEEPGSRTPAIAIRSRTTDACVCWSPSIREAVKTRIFRAPAGLPGQRRLLCPQWI